MGSLGFSEILVILVLALVVFGPTRLPGIARQIGRALGELRKVSGQFQDEIKSSLGIDYEFPYMSGPAKRPLASGDQTRAGDANGGAAQGTQAEPPRDVTAEADIPTSLPDAQPTRDPEAPAEPTA